MAQDQTVGRPASGNTQICLDLDTHTLADAFKYACAFTLYFPFSVSGLMLLYKRFPYKLFLFSLQVKQSSV